MTGRMAMCAVALMLGLPAAAETIGTITASVDGGAERTWFITTNGAESQSGWVGIMPGSLNGASFHLWGNPGEADLAATSDVLMLGAILMRGPGGVIATGEAGYLENGFSRHWVSLEDSPVEMTLERAELSGEVLEIEGSFTARVHYTEDPAAQVVDRDRAMTVTGRFEAALPKD